jgi:hypothetical protein
VISGLPITDLPGRRIRPRRALVAAVLLTVAAAVTAILAESHMDLEWLNYRDSYEEFGVSLMVAVAMRFALLMCGPMTGGVPRAGAAAPDVVLRPWHRADVCLPVAQLRHYGCCVRRVVRVGGRLAAGWRIRGRDREPTRTVGVPLGGGAPARMGIPTLVLRETHPPAVPDLCSSADFEGLSSTSRDRW